MTYVVTDATAAAVASPMLSRPQPFLDLAQLRSGIADRRRQLLELELSMVAECETTAARGRGPSVVMGDRQTWDQATWSRYLAAAATIENRYGPPMRQLYREIDQLERVVALPLARRAA